MTDLEVNQRFVHEFNENYYCIWEDSRWFGIVGIPGYYVHTHSDCRIGYGLTRAKAWQEAADFLWMNWIFNGPGYKLPEKINMTYPLFAF